MSAVSRLVGDIMAASAAYKQLLGCGLEDDAARLAASVGHLSLVLEKVVDDAACEAHNGQYPAALNILYPADNAAREADE